MKVLITGGCGKCATVLKRLQMDKVFMDISPPVDSMKDEQFLQGDIRDTQFLLKSMIDCTVVIHLAGSTDPEQPWEQNLEHNILGTQTVLKTAAKLGIDKVMWRIELSVNCCSRAVARVVFLPVRTDALRPIAAASGATSCSVLGPKIIRAAVANSNLIFRSR